MLCSSLDWFDLCRLSGTGEPRVAWHSQLYSQCLGNLQGPQKPWIYITAKSTAVATPYHINDFS